MFEIWSWGGIKRYVRFDLTDNGVLELGNDVVIGEYTYFQLTKPEPKVVIGDGVIIGRNCMITAKKRIEIGKDTIIGGYVQIIDHDHSFKKGILIKDQEANIKPVKIGEGVWIGAGAKILKGVVIGDGAVIGANSVVTKNVGKGIVVGGVPAKQIKERV